MEDIMPAKIPPLEAVIKMGAAHPRLWELISTVVDSDYGDALPGWNRDLCYCPIAAARAALQADSSPAMAVSNASYVAALAAWRRGKFIYSFDPALAEEFYESATDAAIPVDILYHLPAQCIFIDFSRMSQKPGFPAGFFTHIECDPETGERELRLHFIDRDGELLNMNIVHLLPGGTVNDGIDAAIETIRQNADKMAEALKIPAEKHTIAVEFINRTRETAVQALQYVLYICSENAEISEDRAQKKIYRKRNKVMDRIEEIRKWEVGVKTGQILRRQEQQRMQYAHTAETTPGNGSPKRTHLRRAHWHHFWVGSGENRQLVLRWISSTIINPDGSTPPTIIKLKNKPH